jgi:hypothetical protein
LIVGHPDQRARLWGIWPENTDTSADRGDPPTPGRGPGGSGAPFSKGRLTMETMPSALLKDLLSTGYFYEDLKAYKESPQIDLPFYSKNYTIPYLNKLLVLKKSSGEVHGNEILILAIDHLTNSKDEELTDSIFELKSITTSEIDSNERMLHQLGSEDKSRLKACRQKSQAAQTLSKLLVSIIKIFKLSEGSPKRGAGKTQKGDFDVSPELLEAL